MIRGQKVMLDSDLASMYSVATKRLNEAKKRNIKRFPKDFMFRLVYKEFSDLKSQIATSSWRDWGGNRKMPYAFTEHGAIMAASILNSKKAVEMSVFVVRAFVQLREMLSTQKGLSERIDKIEKKLEGHDDELRNINNTLKCLMPEPMPKFAKVTGFTPDKEGEKP